MGIVALLYICLAFATPNQAYGVTDAVQPSAPKLPVRCEVERKADGTKQAPSWITPFRSLPKADRESFFDRLPEDQQIEFAVCIAHWTYPGDLEFEGRIASRGEAAVSALIDALERGDDNLASGVLEIFAWISLTRYDLRQRPDLMRRIEDRVARFNTHGGRDSALLVLSQIQKHTWKIDYP